MTDTCNYDQSTRALFCFYCHYFAKPFYQCVHRDPPQYAGRYFVFASLLFFATLQEGPLILMINCPRPLRAASIVPLFPHSSPNTFSTYWRRHWHAIAKVMMMNWWYCLLSHLSDEGDTNCSLVDRVQRSCWEEKKFDTRTRNNNNTSHTPLIITREGLIGYRTLAPPDISPP